MALSFRDTYNLEMSNKRQNSKGFILQKNLSLKIENNVIFDQMNAAQGQVNDFQSNLDRLNALQVSNPGDTALQREIAQEQSRVANANTRLTTFQTAAIGQMISDNEKSNGRNPKLSAAEVAAKFFVVKQINPNIDPIQFTEQEIRNNPSTGVLPRVQNTVDKISNAATRFKNIIEGRPNAESAAMQSRDPYAIFDPAVCGLVALDNEGNILATDDFNIPFQYISEFKDSKSSSWESMAPPGRFEPYQIYTGAEPYSISFTVDYHAFDTGANSDEGFIQEMKDRWLASQYPIYSKNQRSGVRSYGAPNKYLLNIFSRYVNIPVVIQHVSIDKEYALDPFTWLAMGFTMNVELKTSFRISQVISADDIVTKGLRAYSHRQNF